MNFGGDEPSTMEYEGYGLLLYGHYEGCRTMHLRDRPGDGAWQQALRQRGGYLCRHAVNDNLFALVVVAYASSENAFKEITDGTKDWKLYWSISEFLTPLS